MRKDLLLCISSAYTSSLTDFQLAALSDVGGQIVNKAQRFMSACSCNWQRPGLIMRCSFETYAAQTESDLLQMVKLSADSASVLATLEVQPGMQYWLVWPDNLPLSPPWHGYSTFRFPGLFTRWQRPLIIIIVIRGAPLAFHGSRLILSRPQFSQNSSKYGAAAVPWPCQT